MQWMKRRLQQIWMWITNLFRVIRRFVTAILTWLTWPLRKIHNLILGLGDFIRDEPYVSGLLLVGPIILWIGFIYSHSEVKHWSRQFAEDLYANSGAELLAIALTYVLIQVRSDQRAQRAELSDLITQMGSPDNTMAVEATRILRDRPTGALDKNEPSWLIDGSLKGADLEKANLQGADLTNAELGEANLTQANLRNASLWSTKLKGVNLTNANLNDAILNDAELHDAKLYVANLRRAKLIRAKLHRSYLDEADLRDAILNNAELPQAYLYKANLGRARLHEAKLQGANLEKAKLHYADLRACDLGSSIFKGTQLHEVNLHGANLVGADFTDAVFSSGTKLPDGTYWTFDVDMARFTNPDHDDYWELKDGDTDPEFWKSVLNSKRTVERFEVDLSLAPEDFHLQHIGPDSP